MGPRSDICIRTGSMVIHVDDAHKLSITLQQLRDSGFTHISSSVPSSGPDFGDRPVRASAASDDCDPPHRFGGSMVGRGGDSSSIPALQGYGGDELYQHLTSAHAKILWYLSAHCAVPCDTMHSAIRHTSIDLSEGLASRIQRLDVACAVLRHGKGGIDSIVNELASRRVGFSTVSAGDGSGWACGLGGSVRGPSVCARCFDCERMPADKDSFIKLMVHNLRLDEEMRFAVLAAFHEDSGSVGDIELATNEVAKDDGDIELDSQQVAIVATTAAAAGVIEIAEKRFVANEVAKDDGDIELGSQQLAIVATTAAAAGVSEIAEKEFAVNEVAKDNGDIALGSQQVSIVATTAAAASVIEIAANEVAKNEVAEGDGDIQFDSHQVAVVATTADAAGVIEIAEKRFAKDEVDGDIELDSQQVATVATPPLGVHGEADASGIIADRDTEAAPSARTQYCRLAAAVVATKLEVEEARLRSEARDECLKKLRGNLCGKFPLDMLQRCHDDEVFFLICGRACRFSSPHRDACPQLV